MDLEEDTKATPSRYLKPEERPSIVRLNISRDQSVVGVNCPIDEARFVKRKRRARCGLCNGCRRTDDCGACSNCRGECIKTSCKLRDVVYVSSRSKTSFRHNKQLETFTRNTCHRRLCINLVEQYDVKEDGAEGKETTDEAAVVVIAT